MGEKMINLTIDGVQLQVPEGTSVMSAAAGVGIEVPHLCFLKDINEISACKVCVVEVQGKSKLITACNSPVEEGMVVYTNSPKVRRVRKTNVELILSQHDCHCASEAVTVIYSRFPTIWEFWKYLLPRKFPRHPGIILSL